MERPLYDRLAAELSALLRGERDFLANLANCAALVYHALPDLNWAGFYLLKEQQLDLAPSPLAGEGRGEGFSLPKRQQLVLGPFQGKAACVRIDLGRGVCGTAAQRRETVIVPDVHQFAGHIACDAVSRSEIVVPMLAGDQLLGVLDLDSPRVARFDTTDALGLEGLVRLLLGGSEFELALR
jgi:GAF domain-containing protein